VLAAPAPLARGVSTYFVADAMPVSTPELTRAIAVALGVTQRLVPIPLSLLHFAGACLGAGATIDRLTGSLVVDTHAFRTAFAWEPPRSLAKELADLVRARRATVAAPL
jgi:nucleoside-diphosphate-sugar epimerase